ncbi:MAG: MFS transporter, partial [Cyclobacteriaceae bacterium]
SGICMIGLAGAWFMPDLSVNRLIILMVVIEIVLTAARIFFTPAALASLPDIVPRARLEAANSLHSSSISVVRLIGDGAGGVLFRILGAPLLFLIDGITYLTGAFMSLFINLSDNHHSKAQPINGTGFSLSGIKSDLVSGFKLIWHTPGLRQIVILNTIIQFFNAPLAIVFPFFIEDYLGLTPDWFGYSLAAMSTGGLIGMILAGSIPLSGNRKAFSVLLAIVLAPVLIVIVGFISNVGLLLGCLTCIGLSFSYSGIHITSVIQRKTAREMRGRVMSNLFTLSMAFTPVSMALVGLYIDAIGDYVNYIFMSLGTIMMASQLPLLFNSKLRKFISE